LTLISFCLKIIRALSELVMNIQARDRIGRASAPRAEMIHVQGGMFRMGSDKHYPEEAPAHHVTVDSFWIDCTPVTNRAFRAFVEATGYITFAEIAPDAKDYPGALPHMLKAGSMVFNPPAHAVDLRDWSQWSTFAFGANRRKPYGPGSSIKGLDDHPVVHIAYRRGLRAMGGQRTSERSRVGVRCTWRTRRHGAAHRSARPLSAPAAPMLSPPRQ
jgi:Sulfatase-modifying factor enzyme 1